MKRQEGPQQTRGSRLPRAVAIAVLFFALGVSVLAIPLFFLTMLLAGPHSDLLPAFLEPIVLLTAWATLLGVPSWLAIRGYRWQMRPASTMRDAA